jgi:TonB family protein
MKTLQLFIFASLVISGSTAVAPAVLGQNTANTINWQILKPEGEEFTVDMPKEPKFETGKMPYHRMELNTRLYLSETPGGATFAIVSLSGIKSNPALYSELERLNSYVDAFKKFLAPRLKGKDAIAKLTLVGARTLNGHQGREYKIAIGDLSGKARVFGTKRRFYAIAFLDKKKSDEVQDQFISSFVLPEKVEEAPTVAEQNVKPEVSPEDTAKAEVSKEQAARDAEANKNAPNKPDGATDAPETKAPESANANPGAKKPIAGGVLNGKALVLPKPEYPPTARAAKAAGSVTVQITVDEYGTVISAQAVSGHPLLQQSAVSAAYMARFSPTFLMGEPVKVSGLIVYQFVAQ